MAKADLTAERLRELLHYDQETGVFRWVARRGAMKAGDVAGAKDHDGYILIRVERRLFKAHRLAWFYVHGVWPKGDIDHKNGCTADNRLDNLRDVSRTVNAQNQRNARAASGLMGAYWFAPAKRWMSCIQVLNAKKHLGYFNTAEDAHAAYIAAKRKYHEGCTI